MPPDEAARGPWRADRERGGGEGCQITAPSGGTKGKAFAEYKRLCKTSVGRCGRAKRGRRLFAFLDVRANSAETRSVTRRPLRSLSSKVHHRYDSREQFQFSVLPVLNQLLSRGLWGDSDWPSLAEGRGKS